MMQRGLKKACGLAACVLFCDDPVLNRCQLRRTIAVICLAAILFAACTSGLLAGVPATINESAGPIGGLTEQIVTTSADSSPNSYCRL